MSTTEITPTCRHCGEGIEDDDGTWYHRDSQQSRCDGPDDADTSALLNWVASHLDRVAYVDEAAQEYGHADSGLAGDLAAGQYAELREVCDLLIAALADVEAGR